MEDVSFLWLSLLSSVLFLVYDSFVVMERKGSILIPLLIIPSIWFDVFLTANEDCIDVFTELSIVTSKSHSWVVITVSMSITVYKKLGSSFSACITLHLSFWSFICSSTRVTQHCENPLQFSAVKLYFYYYRCFMNISRLCHLGIHLFSRWFINKLNSLAFSRNLCCIWSLYGYCLSSRTTLEASWIRW